jgi:hypothetical protein
MAELKQQLIDVRRQGARQRTVAKVLKRLKQAGTKSLGSSVWGLFGFLVCHRDRIAA